MDGLEVKVLEMKSGVLTATIYDYDFWFKGLPTADDLDAYFKDSARYVIES